MEIKNKEIIAFIAEEFGNIKKELKEIKDTLDNMLKVEMKEDMKEDTKVKLFIDKDKKGTDKNNNKADNPYN
jgi:Sec-independent protein translocase protein TatA